MGQSIRPGVIIQMKSWPDRRGGNPKDRRSVVIRMDDVRDSVLAVAISSRFDPKSKKHVRLACTARTGLTVPCAAICDWVERIPISDIDVPRCGWCHPPENYAQVLKETADHPLLGSGASG